VEKGSNNCMCYEDVAPQMILKFLERLDLKDSGDRTSILPNWKKKSITHHWFALDYKKRTDDKNPKVGEFVIG
jgi:hypothetical protein